RANLVRHVVGTIDLGTVNHCNQVNLDKVTHRYRAVDRNQSAKACTKLVKLSVKSRVIRGKFINRYGDLAEFGQLHLGADVDLNLDQKVAREVLIAGPLLDICARTADRTKLVG